MTQFEGNNMPDVILDNGNFPEYYEEWLECEKCGFAKDVD